MATVNDGMAEIKPANVVKTRSWSTKSVLFTALKFLAMAVIFGLAYTQAIQFNDDKGVAEVIEAACKGCGVCVAACGSNVPQQRGYLDNQIFAEIEGALAV
jgi:heterodisulfide reductase subunit A-like polyferredoxin